MLLCSLGSTGLNVHQKNISQQQQTNRFCCGILEYMLIFGKDVLTEKGNPSTFPAKHRQNNRHISSRVRPPSYKQSSCPYLAQIRRNRYRKKHTRFTSCCYSSYSLVSDTLARGQNSLQIHAAFLKGNFTRRVASVTQNRAAYTRQVPWGVVEWKKKNARAGDNEAGLMSLAGTRNSISLHSCRSGNAMNAAAQTLVRATRCAGKLHVGLDALHKQKKNVIGVGTRQRSTTVRYQEDTLKFRVH